ncbi:MAG: BTAD domain-containing putative transcriptional regulator, partial [Anaerolineae bacterium]
MINWLSMETLDISLLGSLQVMVGERPLTRFRTQKLQALLIYLAVEKAKVHRRETLMGLLWPDLPQQSARDTLRQPLSLLRKTIPTQTDANGNEITFLLSDRQTAQINPDYPLTVDVHQILTLSDAGQKQNDARLLQQAVDLVQGDFLANFYLADSNTFEGWAEMQRERLRRLTLEAMAALTAVYLSQHQFTQAERVARRQIEIDDLREDAHRQLMTALANNGRRHEALAQYDALHKLLWDELGIAPEPVTQTLLAQIEAGELVFPPVEPVRPTAPKGERPFFLEMSVMTPASEHDAFVARTAELAQLHVRLAQVVSGNMGVVFVTGEAGQGKSALLQAFMKQAIRRYKTLLVADGTCSAMIGTGDPYHPMRQWMAMLSGDLESKWGLGAISSKWARRLWQAAPAVVERVLAHGPNLPGTLVSIATIEKRLGSRLPTNKGGSVSQPALFAQVTAVLQALAQQFPLLLVLDD